MVILCNGDEEQRFKVFFNTLNFLSKVLNEVILQEWRGMVGHIKGRDFEENGEVWNNCHEE